MPFSVDDLEMLRRDLAQLPPNRPKTVSKHAAVVALVSELAAAQRLGYSVEELAELLSGKGLQMTPGTLRSYLRRARKKCPGPKRVAAESADTNTATVAAISAQHPVAPRPRVAPLVPTPSLPPPSPLLEANVGVPVGRGWRGRP